MTTKSLIILKIMNVLFWIIFIGLCIKTGVLLFTFLVSLYINPDEVKNLSLDTNLIGLYKYNLRYYAYVMSFMIAISGLQAYIAFLVVKIFLKFNFLSPFNTNVTLIITTISHFALGTGILAIIANGYTDWLDKKGIAVSNNWSGGEYLFLAGIIFIISEVYKKGIEIQTENELTV